MSSVALQKANFFPEAATVAQLIVPCQCETSMPSKVVVCAWAELAAAPATARPAHCRMKSRRVVMETPCSAEINWNLNKKPDEVSSPSRTFPPKQTYERKKQKWHCGD